MFQCSSVICKKPPRLVLKGNFHYPPELFIPCQPSDKLCPHNRVYTGAPDLVHHPPLLRWSSRNSYNHWGHIPPWSLSQVCGVQSFPRKLLSYPCREHHKPLQRCVFMALWTHEYIKHISQYVDVFSVSLLNLVSPRGCYWTSHHECHCPGRGSTRYEEKISNWPPCCRGPLFRDKSKETDFSQGTHSSRCLSHLWKKSGYCIVCWSF